MSTISPPLGLAGAAPWKVRARLVELSLRSEGAVNSTMIRSRSRDVGREGLEPRNLWHSTPMTLPFADLLWAIYPRC